MEEEEEAEETDAETCGAGAARAPADCPPLPSTKSSPEKGRDRRLQGSQTNAMSPPSWTQLSYFARETEPEHRMCVHFSQKSHETARLALVTPFPHDMHGLVTFLAFLPLDESGVETEGPG